MCFQSFMGIDDPFDDNIEDFIAGVQRSKIKLRVVTGDNYPQAVAAGIKLGILKKRYEDYQNSNEQIQVIEGEKFRNQLGGIEQYKYLYNQQIYDRLKDLNYFQRYINELQIIYRASAEDKILVVTGLKQLKFVVAVTGDETEDIKALKKAQVGIAIGESNNVVKQAADIILENNSIRSILHVIKYGRNLYEFTRNYFLMQMLMVVVVFVLLFMNSFQFYDVPPFSTVQILFLNLIIDELSTRELSKIDPADELMQEPPISPSSYVINASMVRNIIIQTIFQSFVLYKVLRNQLLFWDSRQELNDTFCFTTFVFFQLFNAITSSSINTQRAFWPRFQRRVQFTYKMMIIVLFYICISYFASDYIK